KKEEEEERSKESKFRPPLWSPNPALTTIIVPKSSPDHRSCFQVLLRPSRLSMIPDPTTSVDGFMYVFHGVWCSPSEH
ncbi:hypothetical protein LINGRAHAP2_LOCUS6255, partial [Linum grandiflorum]